MSLPTKSQLEARARNELDSVMANLGLLPFKGKSAAWRTGDKGLIVWIVDDSKARDPYRGGAFTAEFERTHNGSWMEKLSGRARLAALLRPDEFAALVAYQNEVIARLDRPPVSHLTMVPESLRARYLSAFEPVGVVRRPEFWMRYSTVQDIIGWMAIVAQALPEAVGRATKLDPHVLYLGKDLSWE